MASAPCGGQTALFGRGSRQALHRRRHFPEMAVQLAAGNPNLRRLRAPVCNDTVGLTVNETDETTDPGIDLPASPSAKPTRVGSTAVSSAHRR